MTTRIMRGHVLDRLRDLPDNSVHCVVTSPPYWGLRDYKIPPQVWPDGWAGALGLEPAPALYIAHLVEIFREVRRVLRRDGTLWLNIGDSYATGAGKANIAGGDMRVAWQGRTTQPNRMPLPGLKPKDLIGIPWMLAFALRDDGWWLRSEITWAKRAPMPESVTDRPTSATEKVFLLTKSARYFYDAEAVKEDASEDSAKNGYSVPKGGFSANAKHANTDQPAFRAIVERRNMRNWWLLGPAPFPEAHFATFPPEVPRRAILAGTSERGVCAQCGAPWARLLRKITDYDGQRADALVYTGSAYAYPQSAPRGPARNFGEPSAETLGWRATCRCAAEAPIPATVLDPFLGSGTTALVADRLGRDCIGIELSADYAAMAEGRVRGDAPLLVQLAAD